MTMFSKPVTDVVREEARKLWERLAGRIRAAVPHVWSDLCGRCGAQTPWFAGPGGLSLWESFHGWSTRDGATRCAACRAMVARERVVQRDQALSWARGVSEDADIANVDIADVDPLAVHSIDDVKGTWRSHGQVPVHSPDAKRRYVENDVITHNLWPTTRTTAVFVGARLTHVLYAVDGECMVAVVSPGFTEAGLGDPGGPR